MTLHEQKPSTQPPDRPPTPKHCRCPPRRPCGGQLWNKNSHLVCISIGECFLKSGNTPGKAWKDDEDSSRVSGSNRASHFSTFDCVHALFESTVQEKNTFFFVFLFVSLVSDFKKKKFILMGWRGRYAQAYTPCWREASSPRKPPEPGPPICFPLKTRHYKA